MTKAELINSAAAKMRISGLTVSLEPEEQQDFLIVLEGMMREFDSRSICTNYNYDDPDINSDSGVKPMFTEAAAWNLAYRMMPYFGREPDRITDQMSTQGLSNWAARTAKVNKIQPPSTQPYGSGNERRTLNQDRFYPHVTPVKTECEGYNGNN